MSYVVKEIFTSKAKVRIQDVHPSFVGLPAAISGRDAKRIVPQPSAASATPNLLAQMVLGADDLPRLQLWRRRWRPCGPPTPRRAPGHW